MSVDTGILSPSKQLKYILDEQVGTIISKIDIIEFPKSDISVMLGYICNRMMSIPVIGKKDDELELKVTNNTEDVMIVRSSDIKSEKVQIHYKNIMVMHLLPGESVHFRMRLTEGNGRDHPWYRRVAKAYMGKDESGNPKVFYEPLKGYSDSDIIGS